MSTLIRPRPGRWLSPWLSDLAIISGPGGQTPTPLIGIGDSQYPRPSADPDHPEAMLRLLEHV